MSSFDNNDPSDIEPVEIVDLDADRPTHPFLQRLRKFSLPSRTRTLLFSLALTISLLLLAWLVIPWPALQPKPTARPAHADFRFINPHTPLDLVTTQGLSLIHREDSSWLLAKRNSDGKEVWKKQVFSANALYTCTQSDNTSLYCMVAQARQASIAAVRIKDGSIVWRESLAGADYIDIIINKNILYAEDDNNGMYALAAQSGAILWKFPSTSMQGQFSFYGQSLKDRLAFGPDTVAIVDLPDNSTGNPSGIDPEIENADIHTVSVINTRTGQILCRYLAPSTAWKPTIDNGMIYAYTSPNTLQAFSIAANHWLWHYSSPTLTPWNTVEANGIVYAYDSYTTIKALSATDGSLLWQYHAPGMMTAPAKMQQNMLYLATQNALVLALNATDGKLLWQQKLSPAIQMAEDAIDVSGNTIYTNLALRQGTIYALQATTGQIRWHYTWTNPDVVAPVLTGTALYLSKNAMSLDAKNADDGSQRWLRSVPAMLVDTLQTGGDLLYARQDNGMVTVIRSSDGKMLWQFSLAQLI